jgi:type I restriction enzyme M protein
VKEVQFRSLLDVCRSDGSTEALADAVASVAFLTLLRWAASQSEEQEAIALFEEREFRPQPSARIWSSLVNLKSSDDSLHLQRIKPHLQEKKASLASESPIYDFEDVLFTAAKAFDPGDVSEEVLDVSFAFVKALPFETSQDRLQASEIFDELIDKALELTPYAGEFVTPQPIADLMVEIANPQPGERVYDPCFGFGSLLAGAGARIIDEAQLLSTDVWMEIQNNTLHGIEVARIPFLIGLARMILRGHSHPRVELADSLERYHFDSRHRFDLVLAAPPVGAKLEKARAYNYPIKANSVENLFLQHIMASLRPGGRAVVALPEGFLFRSGADEQVRRRLLSEFEIEGVISLPAGAMLPYTRIKPNVLVFRNSEPSSYVWFQEAQVIRGTVNKKSLLFDPYAEARVFRGREESDQAWTVTTQALIENNFDLSVKRRKASELDALIEELRHHDDSLQVLQLGEIAEVLSGIGYTKNDVTKDQTVASVPLLRVTELGKNGELKPPSLYLYRDALERARARRLVQGDVLISTGGTIGKVGRVREAFAGGVPAHGITTVRFNDAEPRVEVLPSYVLRLLQSGPYQQWLVAHAQGTTVRNLTARALRSLPIPIPRREIQEAIATNVRAGADSSEILKSIVTGRASDEFLSFLLSDRCINDLITSGFDESQGVERFSKLAATLRPWRNKAAHERLTGEPALSAWLLYSSKLVEDIAEAFELPKGADRVAMLGIAENKLEDLDEIKADVENDSIRDRLWSIAEAIRKTLTRARESLLARVKVSASFQPAIIDHGTAAEIEVRVANSGSLPLRRFLVETEPDDSSKEVALFQPGEELTWSVQISPKPIGTFPLRIKWNALRLDSSSVNGVIELEYRVRSDMGTLASVTELGGSPYVIATPIDSVDRPDMFFGREDIINRIQRALRTEGPSTVLLLEGVRRSGKTSILKRLLLPELLPEWVPIYCNFQSAEGSPLAAGMEAKSVFRLIAEELVKALNRGGFAVNVVGAGLVPPTMGRFEFGTNVLSKLRGAFNTESPFGQLDLQVEAALEAVGSKRVLLMLDEFDKIQEGIDNGVTSPQVPENIRALFHKHNRLSGIITGTRRIKSLREDYWSALFGIGLPINVSELDNASARALVTKPVEEQLVFSQQARDLVLDLCSRQPYLIQVLCTRIFDECSITGIRTVAPANVEAAAQKMLEDNEHFQTLWDYIGTARRRYMTCLVNRLSKEPDRVTEELIIEHLENEGFNRSDLIDLDDDLSQLRELEVLAMQKHELGSSYYLRIPLFARWITEHIDESIYRRRALSEG